VRENAPPGTPKTGKYALGWRQLTEDWWTAPVMCNSGSNGMHLAIAMFLPEPDFGFPKTIFEFIGFSGAGRLMIPTS
jgi:hypothetical protein